MKHLLITALILCLLLCGCTAPSVPTTQPGTTAAPTTQPTTEPTTVPTTQPSKEPTTVPTEPPVSYHNPLTGEPMDTPMVKRPFAVMLNNVPQAMPLHGAGEADILYEVTVEGGLTRCMAIFSDISAVENIGSVRSARKYFVSVAMGYDAVYVHYGKSDVPGADVGAQQFFDETGWDHMDGTNRGYVYFHTNEDRLNQGYASEHCVFLKGSRAVDFARDNGFTLTRENGIDYGWKFDDSWITVGAPGEKLTVWFNEGGTPTQWHKSTTMTYDATSGKYLAAQYGKDHVDGNTQKTLSFRNVLVLRAPTRHYQDTKLLYVDVVGSGTGYYACNGQVVEINWSRDSIYDPFVYTLKNGQTVTFGVGKTYVAIVPENATVAYE